MQTLTHPAVRLEIRWNGECLAFFAYAGYFEKWTCPACGSRFSVLVHAITREDAAKELLDAMEEFAKRPAVDRAEATNES